MNINKLKLLLSAIVCITDIYADININLQNTSSQQVVDEDNLSTIEPAQNGDINNLFDSNSNVSLDSILDALTQNPNDVAGTTNNGTVLNSNVSVLNNGFIQTDNQDDDLQQGILGTNQQLSLYEGICPELKLDFRLGHTYLQTMASSDLAFSEKQTDQ